ADHQWRRDQDVVAVAAVVHSRHPGAHEHTAPAKPAGNPFRYLRLDGKRLAGLTVGDELDSGHKAEAPDLADHGVPISESTKPGKQPLALFGGLLEEILALHDGCDLDAHKASHRHSAIGEPMDEAPGARAQRIDDLA